MSVSSRAEFKACYVVHRYPRQSHLHCFWTLQTERSGEFKLGVIIRRIQHRGSLAYTSRIRTFFALGICLQTYNRVVPWCPMYVDDGAGADAGRYTRLGDRFFATIRKEIDPFYRSIHEGDVGVGSWIEDWIVSCVGHV